MQAFDYDKRVLVWCAIRQLFIFPGSAEINLKNIVLILNKISNFASKPWGIYVVAALAGALLPLAFAPFDLHILAFVSPAILFGLWLDTSPKRAVLIGYAFSMAYIGIGASWVAISMVRFGGVAMPVAVVLTVIIALFLSSYIALSGYVLRRYFSQLSIKVQALAIFPALWGVSEWLRGWVLTGNPWLALGYSQTDGFLSGLIPVLGVFGISFLVCVIAGFLYLLVVEFKTADKVSHVDRKPVIVYVSCIAAIILLANIFHLFSWVEKDGGLIKVSLLQGNIPQEQKWEPKYKRMTIERYLKMTRDNWDSQIIIWPETALPMYFHQAKRLLTSLAKEAEEHNSSVLIGLPVLDEKNPEIYYNSMISLSDNFKFYHKNHLVPFGEYVPLKSLFGGLIQFMNIPMADFTPGGSEQPLLHAAGYAIGMTICFEDAFGEEVIRSLPEASLIVNVSNDAWFGDSLAPHQHLQLARFRAIETGRPMLRATNNGVSALVDSRGRILKISKQFEIEVTTGKVQPMKGSTPYVIWGNYFIISLLISVLTGFYIRSRKAK